LTPHPWDFKGLLNSGPDENGNDQPCFQWFCERCQTIALTYGHYDDDGKPVPKDPPKPDALNCNGIQEDCDLQVVINIMES
jgi:protein tyrosine phosphatase (PTP) superfamily phosphohydrolase (DUF442 family)